MPFSLLSVRGALATEAQGQPVTAEHASERVSGPGRRERRQSAIASTVVALWLVVVRDRESRRREPAVHSRPV